MSLLHQSALEFFNIARNLSAKIELPGNHFPVFPEGMLQIEILLLALSSLNNSHKPVLPLQNI
jgi:hypothetical protein